MNYPLKDGQSSEDILFWMTALSRDRFPRASFYMDGEVIGRQRLSVGLDDSMYARCCPLDEPLDLMLKQDNGDTIFYEAAFPRILRVTGLESFVDEVMGLPPPPLHLKLFYGDLRKRGLFQLSAAFLKLSAAEQLRRCLKLAGESGLKMLVSAAESGGRVVPVTTSAMLLGYKELIDIVLRKDSDTWILLRMATGMVYTSGLRLTEAEKMLNHIITE